MHLAATIASAQGPLPPDEKYVTVGEDGHLHLGGERVRFWGCGGWFPAMPDERRYGENPDMHAINEAAVIRLKQTGFNIIRLWRGHGTGGEYTKGDGSRADLIDHWIYLCKKHGLKIWMAGLGSGVGSAGPSDVGIVDDPATADAWEQAVEKGLKLNDRRVPFWDERIAALRLERLHNTLDHHNQWTGMRLADDPTIVVWELQNEGWWFYETMRGRHLSLPEFFQQQLNAQWNTWLTEKYGNEQALRRAWVGNLLPGESLDEKNIALLPIGRNLTDEQQAKSLGVRIQESIDAPVDNASFNDKRGGDVIDFLIEIWLGSKQTERELVKSAGKSARLSPLIYDTGIGWNMQTQYMHQQADAIAHSVYINGTHHPDPDHRRYPWWTGLDELPKLCWDKPWAEHNKAPNKPFFLYEHNIMQPAKYRGDYAMRLIYAASIQDWDIICAHYWGFPRPLELEKPYERAMDYTTGGHPQGYHFQFDSVLQGAFQAAGEIFTNMHVKPAPEPTTFVFGADSFHDMDMMGYGETGDRFLATLYQNGMRLVIDPEADSDEIIGPSLRRAVYEPNPIRTTEQTTYDWQRAHLKFDTPGAVMFTGFFADAEGPVRFANGVTLRDVGIHNDKDIPYPVTEEERYLTFCIVSRDGLPLSETKDAILLANSTSFNSGFKFDLDHINREWFRSRKAYPKGAGELPVLHARVEAELTTGPIRGMKYRMLDWHLRPLGEGVVEDATWTVPPTKGLYVIELSR